MSDLRPDIDQARRFLTAMGIDPDKDSVTWQTFDDSEEKRKKLARIIHGPLAECWKRLAALNAQGAGIFWTVNETDLKGRTAENVTRVRAAFVDLDGSPIEPVIEGQLTPSLLAESSPGRYHAYWLVSDAALDQFTPIQRALAERFDGDRKVIDLPRVLRVPGFLHQKGDAFLTRLWGNPSGLVYSQTQIVEGFGLDLTEPPGCKATEPVDFSSVLNGVPEGERDDAINKYAWSLRGRGGLSGTEIEALVVIAAANCKPPFPESEARAKVKRALEKIEVPTGEPLSEFGNAARMAQLFGSEIHFCPEFGWMEWTGTHWAIDKMAGVQRRAKETIRSLYAEAAAEKDEERSKALARYALKCQTYSKSRAMIDLLPSEPGISVRPEQFDRDEWSLNCLNGTIDLRTGELRPHRKSDLITKLAPVEYDPRAESPRWDRFISEIMSGNEALTAYVQRSLGHALTGIVTEQSWWFAHGNGGNGKGTLVFVLGEVMGDYAVTTPPETFLETQAGGIRNDLARLRGARLVVAQEPDRRGKFDPGVLKMFTGEDVIAARFLHKEFFEFVPTGKLWFCANNKPAVRDTSHGFWRRVHLVPFLRKFEGATQDQHLRAALVAEAPGILTWLVQGCLAWQQDGLNPPEVVREAVREYRAETDVLSDFIEEHCAIGYGLECGVSELYAAYLVYCEANKIRRPLTKQRFNADLSGRAEITKDRGRSSGHRKWTWFGIGFSDGKSGRCPGCNRSENAGCPEGAAPPHERGCAYSAGYYNA